SSAEKVALTFGISQENVFGSGNFLGVQVNTSKYNRTLSLTTTDPYFTKDGISRTISVYHTTTRPYSTNEDGDYKLVNQGASIRFGVPFSELDTVFFGIGLERYAFDPNRSALAGITTPQSYLNYFDCKRDASGWFVTGCDQKSVWGVPLTVGWGRDSRDSALVPTTGRLQRANLELGVGGDMKYLKSSYQYQQFFAINKQYTFAINGEVGYAKAFGGKTYPIFKNFYAGGLGSIRGFEQNSLGPRDQPLLGQTEGAALGGTKKAIFNAELSTPFPGAGNDRTLRLYGFFDVGNVFGSRAPNVTDEQWKAQKKLRASVGLGISWISPLGPLRLAYAFPVKSQKEVTDPSTGFVVIPKDRIQRLQFQIGTSF
ncbi:MAG: BamA/TamA family outer membrane protein, partial [Variovorax sp.]|nr:BamA/TamA family outer membrane protein [Variovorax sp.]